MLIFQGVSKVSLEKTQVSPFGALCLSSLTGCFKSVVVRQNSGGCKWFEETKLRKRVLVGGFNPFEKY